MVKHLEDLKEIEREIVKTLKTGRSKGLTTPEIQEALVREGYHASLGEVRNSIGELIDYGSVRGYAKKGGDKFYYLSRVLGSGRRNQATLLGGANVFRDTYKFFQRMFGVIYILFGLGFIIYLGLSLTGQVILISSSPSVNLGFYLSFILSLIGGTLIYFSLKK